MCVRINQHTICRISTYVLNYTCKYVQYTYNIRRRSYCIRTRRITYVHVRIRSYVERICTYLTSKEPYVGLTGAVCECISNEYVQILTPCWGHRLYVYERICTYLFRNTYMYVFVIIRTYMYVFVIIRAYTCCTYMHVFLIEIRSVYLPKIRAHAYGHGAVTVALRSPAPAQVSALSPRGCYGKFVARQRKRMQIAKFNHIRSARLISGSWRQLVQACPGQRSCDVGDPLLRH